MASPAYLLAVALMESFAAVEGFVLDRQRRTIVANRVDAAGVWQVDVTSRPRVLREYADITGEPTARSVTSAETAGGRVRAFADHLGLESGTGCLVEDAAVPGA